MFQKFLSCTSEVTVETEADVFVIFLLLYCTSKGHPCTGTEALYRPYSPQGE